MTTKEQKINEVSEQIKAELIARGLEVSVSYSRTDWGMSNYVHVFIPGKPTCEKIRVSDHSVMNTGRILNEYHFHEGWEKEEIFNEIESLVFPERFICVDAVDLVNGLKTANALNEQQMKNRENVVRVNSFTTKKGETRYDVTYYVMKKVLAKKP